MILRLGQTLPRSPKNYMASSERVKWFRDICEKMRFLKFDFLHKRDYNAFLKAVHHSKGWFLQFFCKKMYYFHDNGGKWWGLIKKD